MSFINKKTLSIIISVLSIIGYGYFAFAVAPTGGYSPAQTLDPACAPGDVNCFVQPGWLMTGNAGTNSAVNFIGTTDAQDFIIKGNNIQVAQFGQDGNVAIGSSVTGYGVPLPVASGTASIALGAGATATSLGSFAAGILSQATGFASTAIGFSAQAIGGDAIAIGDGPVARGKDSVSIGYNTESIGERSLAFGSQGLKSYSFEEVALGAVTTVYTPSQVAQTDPSSGKDRRFIVGNGGYGGGGIYDAFTILKNGQTGIGYNNFETNTTDSLLQVNGAILSSTLSGACGALASDVDGKIICGSGGSSGWGLNGNAGTDGGVTNFIGTTDAEDFVVKTNGNTVMRFVSDADGSGSPGIDGFGSNVILSGFSSAFGQDNTAGGFGNVAMVWGESNVASGGFSTAWGNDNIASGGNSTVFGQSNFARSYSETVLGIRGTDHASGFDVGHIQQFDRLFSIGNGDGMGGLNDRNNAYTLWKDGSFAYNDDNFQNDNPGTEQNMFYFNYGNHDGLGGVNTKHAIRLGSATNDEWDIGSSNVGNRSLAFGFEGAIASGYSSIAIGTSAVSGEESTVAIGNNTVANGVQSFAFGFGAQATANNSLALGTSANAGGIGSVAIATGNGSASANGQDSVSMGAGSASGVQSFAINATASGYNAVAINNGAVASGDNSFAVNGSSAQGYNSVSFGQGNNAYSMSESVFGSYVTNYSPVEVNSWDISDRLFTVGNGDDSIPTNSDAFTILKNGQTGIAIDNFEANTNGSIFQVGDGGTGVIGYVNTGTGAWVAVSDARKKNSIQDLSYGLDTVLALSPKSYIMNESGEHSIGFLAQDVLTVVPEAVFGSESKGYGMSYATLVPVTVKAIQQLNLKLADIQKVADATDQTLVTNMRNWLANKANGINKIFVKQLCLTDGTDEECITMEQLRQLKQGMPSVPASPAPVVPVVTPDPVVPPQSPDPVPPVSDPVVDPVPDPVVAPDPVPAIDPAPAADPAPVPDVPAAQ